jgi:quercetin dioxygenase-like cupin family protein
MVDDSSEQHPTKALFEAAHTSVRLVLERIVARTHLTRKAPRDWEEIYVFGKRVWTDESPIDGTYLCLPPRVPMPRVQVEGTFLQLLRATHSSRAETLPNLDSKALGKPYIKPTRVGELSWNEIPSRRPNDPGGRVAELSRNPDGSRITSLMECRPGWILEEHEHPSDVLTFCLQGGGLLGIEDKTEPYLAGQLVAIPAGKRHRFQTGEQGALLIIFVFEPFLV